MSTSSEHQLSERMYGALRVMAADPNAYPLRLVEANAVQWAVREIEELQAMRMKAGTLDLCLTYVRAENKRLREVLHWLDIQGGLGHEKHARIREVLADERVP